MGGARRQPMAAGEGKRHANERGWRGNPGRGRGLHKPLRAFWKWLERGARVLVQRRGGSLGAGSGSFLHLAFSFANGKQARARAHTRTKNTGGLLPALALLFLYYRDRKSKAKGKSGCITPYRPRSGCADSYRPDHPVLRLEGQVLTNLCHSCQIRKSPCICLHTCSALKSKVIILYDPREALK